MTSDSLADGRPRLCFLHGVRALAALAVVLFHLTLNTAPDSAGPVIRAINVPLLHGYLAVPVFLVLSGFLLAMPVVTNGLTLRAGCADSFAAGRCESCRRIMRRTCSTCCFSPQRTGLHRSWGVMPGTLCISRWSSDTAGPVSWPISALCTT